MTFLAVLIGLFFYRNWQGGNPVEDKVPTDNYFGWMQERVTGSPWRYLLSVGIPVLVVLYVAVAVSHWLQGLIWLAVSLIVLIYCFDMEDLSADFSAHLIRLKSVTEDDDFADVVQLQEDFQADHLYSMFQSIVPVLFWFLITGPAGALAYALSIRYLDALDDDSKDVTVVENVVYWMEWVPTRITGLFFCLAGNFGPAFDYWLNQIIDTHESNETHLAVMAGLAADVPQDDRDDVVGFAQFSEVHVTETKYLCERALFGWLGFAAIFTIFVS